MLRKTSSSSPVQTTGLYADLMLQIFEVVTAFGCPNFKADRFPLTSNLNFMARGNIVCTEEDEPIITYLRYGFPVGHEGPVPTPSSGNHPSANKHCADVAAYITKELREGVMLGPFDSLPFTP